MPESPRAMDVFPARPIHGGCTFWLGGLFAVLSAVALPRHTVLSAVLLAYGLPFAALTLLRPRAVVLTNEGIEVRRRFGRGLVIPWSEVLGARLEPAGVRLLSRATSPRIGGLVNALALTQAINQRLTPGEVAPSGAVVPTETVAEWLGIEPSGRRVIQAPWPWRAVAGRGLLTVAAALFAVALGTMLPELMLLAILSGVAVPVLVLETLRLLWNAWLDRQRRIIAEATGLRVRDAGRWLEIGWADLVHLERGHPPEQPRRCYWTVHSVSADWWWHVGHTRGSFCFAPTDHDAEPLRAALEQATAARERGDRLPEAMLASDAAISRVRMDGAATEERGLSIAEAQSADG